MATNEYAKFVKVLANDTNARGFQTTLKLPSAKTMSHDYDFINFYVGLHGFECGISTKRSSDFYVSGEYKWHWFVNGPEQASGPMEFSEGDTITILLAIDESQSNKIVFKVNGVTKFTSSTSGYSGTDNARLIIGCAQSTGTALPLAPWGVFHNQVEAAAMKYKNSSAAWVDITSSNAAVTKFRTPGPEVVSDANNPDPDYYTKTDIINSTIYASLKQ